MIAFKPIHTSFTNTKYTLFHARRPIHAKGSILCLCRSSKPESEANPPEGDVRTQELLAQIALIQVEKARAIDYLDETAANLTKFAKEANAELDKIGEDALKEFDEASKRRMAKMDEEMQAFEESARLKRIEIENSEKKLADFEGQLEKERNEGMFFKNLGQRAPLDPAGKAGAMEEAKKIKDLTKAKAGSKTRITVYFVLTGLIVVEIADSVISSPDWGKVAVLGAILVGLITQLSYELRISSEIEETERKKKDA
ncbi:hypothetical protein Tsubulata_036469 [Turnera subulata]|uniref:Uncharacterized protein n=1 Tax=Turnera subulata TaxID=218843 RepID=A0A9Q0JBS3_9ROSI|nr:hypothetical protein Tsubulata_036469 [Turnera subulata]